MTSKLIETLPHANEKPDLPSDDSTIERVDKSRRGIVTKVVGGLAAYAASFAVANVAKAACPTAGDCYSVESNCIDGSSAAPCSSNPDKWAYSVKVGPRVEGSTGCCAGVMGSHQCWMVGPVENFCGSA